METDDEIMAGVTAVMEAKRRTQLAFAPPQRDVVSVLRLAALYELAILVERLSPEGYDRVVRLATGREG